MFINQAIDLECLRAVGEFSSSVTLTDSSSQINYSEPVSCKPKNSEILYTEKAGGC